MWEMRVRFHFRADAAFETLKQTFGASNCFMLSINSKTTVDPCLPSDYWTPFIKRASDTIVSTVYQYVMLYFARITICKNEIVIHS